MVEVKDVILKKYELIVKNIEFLDSWVMKTTAVYGVFIFGVLYNIEKIIGHNKTLPFFVIGMVLTAAIFFGVILRIDFLMRKQTKTLKKIDKRLKDLKVGSKDISVLPEPWGKGIFNTTSLCGCFIFVTAIVSVIAVAQGKG
ncbi:hypothetical protein ACFL2O_00985 [Thermodesulfobacteriota bacterium]